MTRAFAHRLPRPSERGLAVAATGLLLFLLAIGAAEARFALLGAASWFAAIYAYVRFTAIAAAVWRRHIELAVSHGERTLVAGRSFELHARLRMRVPVALGRVHLSALASSSVTATFAPSPLHHDASSSMHSASITVSRAGRWFLHGITATLSDSFGLFRLPVYFPCGLELEVLPRGAVAPIMSRSSARAAFDRVGPIAARARDVHGELRELRDHAPGDPFRIIAWKATARTGRLMVREHDRENLLTHYVLVDVAGSMRTARDNRTRLDRAIELAVAYADQAFREGDRVGLVTFAERVHTRVAPGSGPAHRTRLLDRLLESANLVDEDVTEATDAELIRGVAAHLLEQRGLDARVPRAPALEDPLWDHLWVTPEGALLDQRIIEPAVRETAGRTRAHASRVSSSTPQTALLRQYCRDQGIELAPRRLHDAGARTHGLERALLVALSGRGADRVLVLSDLEDLSGSFGRLQALLARAARQRRRVVCAQPCSAETERSQAQVQRARKTAEEIGLNVVGA